MQTDFERVINSLISRRILVLSSERAEIQPRSGIHFQRDAT